VYDAPAKNAKSQSAKQRRSKTGREDIRDDLLQVAFQRKISVKFAGRFTLPEPSTMTIVSWYAAKI